MIKKVGIIGAGMAGLTLAHKLTEQGFLVEIFDKGRAAGGRTSSRRTEWGYLDHGAQYLTIRDAEFKAFLATHLPPDLFVPWETNFARLEGGQIIPENLADVRYIPRHSMARLCRHLAANLSLKTEIKIAHLKRDNLWILEDSNENDYGPFDLVIITAPPPQTVQLLGNYSTLGAEINQVEMWPCWTLMLIAENKLNFPFGGIKCNHPVLGWIALNSSKPERGDWDSLVIQGNWQWSADNIDQEPEVVGSILQQEAEAVLRMNFGPIKYKSVHLWRYAAPKNEAKQPYFLDLQNHLGVGGDWCVAAKIEGAFLSAISLYQAILAGYQS